MKAKVIVDTSKEAERYLTELIAERNKVVDAAMKLADKYLKDIIETYDIKPVYTLTSKGLGIVELFRTKGEYTKSLSLFYVHKEDIFITMNRDRIDDLQELVDLIYRKLF